LRGVAINVNLDTDKPSRNIELLRTNRNFLLIWLADFVSSLGDRVHQVAMAALVYTVTGSLTQTGIAFVATALPDLVLGPFAGVLVDRRDRRQVLIACDLLRIPPVLAIPFVADISILLVYILLFMVNSISVLFKPARRAIVPSIVKPKDYNTANSLGSVSENSSDIIGYPLGGGMLLLFTYLFSQETSVAIAFTFDALTYLISAMLIVGISVQSTAYVAETGRTVLREVAEGISFVWNHRLVLANTLVTLLGPIALGASTPLLVGYSWDVLGGGEWEYSLIGAAISIGTVLGGLWLSTKERVNTGMVVVAGLAVMGISVTLTALVSSLVPALIFIGISGFGSAMVLIPGVTLVQDHTPDSMLGRVFSLRTTLFYSAIVFSTFIGGWAGDQFGTQPALLVCGIVLTISVALAAMIPSVRASGLESVRAPGFSED
jgi:MFS transporter, DHA3 family, macrolide efflux protein